MKLNAKDENALIQLLARFEGEIAAIEREYGLTLSQIDIRPRIEYFHDAIRAYTAQNNPARLRVERLTYDLQAMRYLTEKPLAPLDKASLSPITSMVAVAPGLISTKKPDRAIKEQLSESYKQYAMLFAALLKPTADIDYQERTEQLNEQVGTLKAIIDALRNGAAEEINILIHHLNNAQTQQELLTYAKASKGQKNAELPKLMAKLKFNVQKLDKNIRAIDTAHHHYATTQLAIYENAKDSLKRMMSQGMNLVGAFVEASVKSSGQTRNR